MGKEMSTIEERAKQYIEEHDHTTDVLGWEWETDHVIAFAKQEIERERLERIMSGTGCKPFTPVPGTGGNQ